jgi:pimeloyl-ACP methyl ester carboxylesterase
MRVTLILFILFLESFSASAQSDATTTYFKDPVFKIDVFVEQKSLDKPQSILLVHGLGNNASKDWTDIVKEFAKYYHTIAVDLPGFGKSQGKLEEYVTPDTYANFLYRVADIYAKSKVIYIGHSMGGAIGLRYLRKYPDQVDKVVLINVAGILQKSVYTKQLVLENLLHKKEKESYIETLGKSTLRSIAGDLLGDLLEVADNLSLIKEIKMQDPEFRKFVFEDDIGTQAALGLIHTDFSRDLKEIKKPILLIWGSEDQVSPLRTGYLLNYHLKHSKLITISGEGHTPHIVSAKIVSEKIFRWLKEPTFEKVNFPKTSDRAYTCKKKKLDLVISGSFSEMKFKHCNNVKLHNLTAKSIILENSEVELLNVKIISSGVGLTTTGTELKATNLVIEAPIGIKTSGSELDIAGATINYSKESHTADGSLIYWSTSYLRKKGSALQFLHEKQ